MTIAACYLSTEGVVLGADSTATYCRTDGDRHFNHAQKLFEIGRNSTLGFVTWGMGSLGPTSYRTMLAELSDDLLANPVNDGIEVMQRWVDMAWNSYRTNNISAINRLRDLVRINPHSPSEERELESLSHLSGGFCIGGRLLQNLF